MYIGRLNNTLADRLGLGASFTSVGKPYAKSRAWRRCVYANVSWFSFWFQTFLIILGICLNNASSVGDFRLLDKTPAVFDFPELVFNNFDINF